MRAFGVVFVCALVLAPAAAARPLLGIKGNADRFESLTGQNSAVVHTILGWGQGDTWGSSFASLFRSLGGEPMVGLGMRAGGREAITPARVAAGKGDAYLVGLNTAISAFGAPVCIRPFGEMNGYWNVYCAFTKSGRPKPGHATENPMPDTRVIWNPQGYGAPDIPANSAQEYYPGDAYVDVVGNDLYDIRDKAEWEANERLYRAHRNKPYAFPEWGLWGIDDPDFIRTMASFIRTHKRTELAAYFESSPGSIFDLASKPRSRGAYRALITPLG